MRTGHETAALVGGCWWWATVIGAALSGGECLCDAQISVAGLRRSLAVTGGWVAVFSAVAGGGAAVIGATLSGGECLCAARCSAGESVRFVCGEVLRG